MCGEVYFIQLSAWMTISRVSSVEIVKNGHLRRNKCRKGTHLVVLV